MPSPKKSPDLKEVLAILKLAKSPAFLKGLSTPDLQSVMEASQEVTEGCADVFAEAINTFSKVTNSMTQKLNTMRNINPKGASPANPNDLMGYNPNMLGQSGQQNLSPYTPVSPPVMYPQAFGQVNGQNQQLADGQIKLEIPLIQHLEDSPGDEFAPNQMEAFGKPSFTLNGGGINTPVSSPDIPEINPLDIPQAFQATQDAPTES